MSSPLISCPLTGPELLQEYFLENRARLLELASFLDRLERSSAAETIRQDPRYVALLEALRVLVADEERAPSGGDRELARRVQEIFSDPTSEPLASAAGLKGASGAYMRGGDSR